MNELKTGDLLQDGKYRIERLLGMGSFGYTYLAELVNLARKVCIREFRMRNYGTEIQDAFREKFLREARTVAGLDHPGLVQIHDVFEENGTAYYVMDYIEGEDLAYIVRMVGPLPEERALNYIRQVADALTYVHKRGLMHLDVKPSNIIIRRSDDRAVLVDFGGSKLGDADGPQVNSRSMGFAPIELMCPGGVDAFSPETDVYSLAATLYYLVTDQIPPDGKAVLENGLPAMPEKLSKPLREAVKAAMGARKQRPQTVGAFIELLSRKSAPATKQAKKAGWLPDLATDSVQEMENTVQDVNKRMMRLRKLASTFKNSGLLEKGKDIVGQITRQLQKMK